jgi:nucleoside-diphosphate-sugar epimerase
MYGFNSIGLRFFNVYGPGQRFDSSYSAVIPRWINAPDIRVNGDGSTIRDFTYVGDVANSIQCALYGKESHYVANVGTGKGTALKELAMLASGGKKEIVFAEPRASDVKESVANTTLLQSKIGYKPSTTVEEGIQKTRDFYLGGEAKGRSTAIPDSESSLACAAESNLFAQDAHEAQG